jgi:hypothetical protein
MPTIPVQLKLDTMKVLVIVGDLQVWHVAAMA